MTKHFLLVVLVSLSCPPAFSAPEPHYYWPRFPRPETVLTVKDVPSREQAIVLDTLSGLAARAVEDDDDHAMIWSPNAHPAYERWFGMMVRQTGAREQGPYAIWDLVRHFKKEGVVKGYILYHYDDSARGLFEPGAIDTSVNAATALCASLDAVAVSENLEADAKAAGLRRLLDARAMTEESCYEKYKDRFNHKIIALQETKVNEIRSEAVALGSMVFSRPGPPFEKALAALKHDTPVLGWGIGDEMEITKPVSVYGHFITATNWCSNLPLLSTEKIGETYPAARLRPHVRRGIWDLNWETDVHYAAFVMSDGDNVQWLMGDFVEDRDRCYWSNQYRGKVPIGWTTCYVDLAQLCPYTLDYLFQTASPRDDFILFGGGYYYPDLFGSGTGERNLLRLHARRIGRYMQLGNITSLAVNCEKWDSESALNAYETYVRAIPGLKAIFAIQYAPYTAGEGAIKWVKRPDGEETPVLSARFAIWANTHRPRDASPTVIAAQLNAMPHQGGPDTENHFSWVIVHAWSWFKTPEAGAAPGAKEIDQKRGGQPGTGRGLNAVKWCVDALAPHVRVVTPAADLALLVRLHLRPQQTLSDELKILKRRLDTVRETRNTRVAEARELLVKARRSLQQGQYRACFACGKQVAEIINLLGGSR